MAEAYDEAGACSHGAIARWDGTTWQSQDGPSCVDGSGGCCPDSGRGFRLALNSVTGTDADDVWVLESNDRVWHWDGTAWCQAIWAGELPEGLTSLQATARGEVLGIGGATVVRITL